MIYIVYLCRISYGMQIQNLPFPTNTNAYYIYGRYMVQITYNKWVTSNKTYVSGNETMPLICFTDARFNVRKRSHKQSHQQDLELQRQIIVKKAMGSKIIYQEIEVFHHRKRLRSYLLILHNWIKNLNILQDLDPVPKDMRYTDNSGNIVVYFH